MKELTKFWQDAIAADIARGGNPSSMNSVLGDILAFIRGTPDDGTPADMSPEEYFARALHGSEAFVAPEREELSAFKRCREE